MAWLRDLARIARTTGYPVVEVSGWRNRGRAPMSGVRSVICHHTASGRLTGNAPSLNVVRNGRPGISGPLSHFVLARNGTIYVVAAGRANHAGRASSTKYTNSYSIGIEAENDGVGEAWGNKQMDSYAKLVRALIDFYGLSTSDVKGHKEIAVPRGRKIDPTFNMNSFRTMVKNRKGTGLKGEGGSSSGGKYESSKAKHEVGSRTMGLYDGGTDVVWLQKELKKLKRYTGGTVDGYFGPSLKSAVEQYQESRGLAVDGLAGKNTIKALKENAPIVKKKETGTKKKSSSSSVPGKGYVFPLPKGYYFGSKSGGDRSVSGFYKRKFKGVQDRTWIKRFADQLSLRGWSIGKGKTWLSKSGNDGLYGAEYQSLIKRFQKDQGLAQDGLLGKNTWDSAFQNPVS